VSAVIERKMLFNRQNTSQRWNERNPTIVARARMLISFEIE
jgi:hypothetical protein